MVKSLVFAVLLCGAAVYGQTASDWKTYLNSNTVRDVEVRSPYAFAATTGGLLRIDLTSLRVERIDRSAGLPSVVCNALAVDSANQLWIGCEDGSLVRMDASGKLKSYFNYRQAGWAITRLRYFRGYLIVSADKGVSLFSTAKGLAEQNFTKFAEIQSAPVLDAAAVRDSLFVLFDTTLAQTQVNWTNLRATNLNDPSIWLASSIPQAGSFLVDSGQVQPSSGLDAARIGTDRYDVGVGCNKNFLPIAFTGLNASEIAGFGSGLTSVAGEGSRIWCGTQGGGVIVYDGSRWTSLRQNGPVLNYSHTVYKDRDGALWITSGSPPLTNFVGSGVSVLKNGSWQVYHIGNNAAFRSNQVSAVTEHPSGLLFFGQYGGGITSFSRESEEWYNYNAGNSVIASSDGPSYEGISGMVIDEQGTIWSVLAKKGIVRMDLSGTGAIFPTRPSAEDVRSIALDSSGHIWVGYSNPGLVRFDTATGSIIQFSISGMVNSIRVDSKNRVWLATESGLVRLAGNATPQDTLITYLKGENVHDVAFSPPGYRFNRDLIWATSYGKGIKLMDDSGGVLLSYTRDNSEIVSNMVNGLLFDTATSDLWITSDHGISVFRTDLFQVRDNFRDTRIARITAQNGTFYEFDYIPDESKISIYSLDGMLVRRIKAPSQRNVKWFLDNDRGARIKPGLYYYLISSPGVTAKKGKLLVR